MRKNVYEHKEKIEGLINDWMSEDIPLTEYTTQLVSNTDYFEWLIKFTEDKGWFRDDFYLRHPEKLSELDRINVGKLWAFHAMIDRYADRNNIPADKYDYKYNHKVKLNENGLKIGLLVDQGVQYYCERIPVENENEFIDINDVIEYVIQKKETSKIKKLEK